MWWRIPISCVAISAAACAPPIQLAFFTPPRADQVRIRTVVDTVLVRRASEPHTVSTRSVNLAHDLLDRAQRAGRRGVVGEIRSVLAEIPESDRRRTRKRGSEEQTLVRIAHSQGLVVQLDLMRADVIIVKDVRGDTVKVRVPATPADSSEGDTPSVEPQFRIEKWLVLIVTGDALGEKGAGSREQEAGSRTPRQHTTTAVNNQHYAIDDDRCIGDLRIACPVGSAALPPIDSHPFATTSPG